MCGEKVTRAEAPAPSGRGAKVAGLCLILASIAAAALAALILFVDAEGRGEGLHAGTLAGAWLLAVLSGAVGGAARALYSLFFDSYAFQYKQAVGRSSPCIKKVYGIREDSGMDDDFDPLRAWQLYVFKPVAAAALGLVFALALEQGLFAAGARDVDDERRPARLVVAAGMAGMFGESALHKLRALLGRS